MKKQARVYIYILDIKSYVYYRKNISNHIILTIIVRGYLKHIQNPQGIFHTTSISLPQNPS